MLLPAFCFVVDADHGGMYSVPNKRSAPAVLDTPRGIGLAEMGRQTRRIIACSAIVRCDALFRLMWPKPQEVFLWLHSMSCTTPSCSR